MLDVISALQALGYRTGAELGAGMEGVVLALLDDPTRVIKVWHRRDRTELRRLQHFTTALAEAGVAVPFPQVHEVIELADRTATLETAIEGAPLGEAGGVRPAATDTDAEILLETLTALAAVDPHPGLAVLPPLPGEPPVGLDSTGAATIPFTAALSELLRRRYRTHRQVLSAGWAELAGPDADLDRLVAGILDALSWLDSTPSALIHGDLVPPNLMVDPDRKRLTGLLDFGFLTMIGDPAFDAAVAASIFDMYGEQHRRSEAFLDEAIVEAFGYSRHRLAIYRAAYAIITGNAFSADGRDGHFAWCLRMLHREDIRSALPS